MSKGEQCMVAETVLAVEALNCGKTDPDRKPPFADSLGRVKFCMP
jgi:hypothetical protein